MNAAPKLVEIGKWNYMGAQLVSAGIVHFYDLADLNGTKSQSIIISGWAYAGWDNNELYKVDIVILDQDDKGLLKINTSSYLDDPTTNGSGSVIAYDFNSDGIDDIFLPAGNESPIVSTSSTVYLSQPGAKFDKIKLNDSVEAHSATLSNFQGVPTVVTAGYGGLDPYYQFSSDTRNFDIRLWENTHSGSLYASCALVADLDSDGISEIVIGDFLTGPGVPFNANRPADIAIYKILNGKLDNAPAAQLNPYFNQEKYKNIGLNSEGGASLNHTYRTWLEDFNHDGKDDLLFGVGIWSKNDGWSRAKLQMFQNNGDLDFSDVTDTLGEAYDEKSSFVDYSMQLMDIDGSGINSFLLAGDPGAKGSYQSNYLLLNDGTGKLHLALHDEFSAWSGGRGGKFIPYIRNDGLLNYLHVDQQLNLFNFDLRYDATKDFKNSVSIQDRNKSKLIRTFAGNDAVSDVNASGDVTQIDGGLGFDICEYHLEKSNYNITYNPDGTTSVKAPNGSIDILRNIERLQFSDSEMNLPILGSAAADIIYGTNNNDQIKGLTGNDKLIGLSGNDIFDGGTGNDTIDGGSGTDTVTFTNSLEGILINLTKGKTQSIAPNDVADVGIDNLKSIENVIGGNFDDKIFGSKLANKLEGADGNDSIDGGLGADTLIGGNGADLFVFSSKLSAPNIDMISDFAVGEDQIQLNSKIFDKLKAASNFFAVGADANSPTNFVMYNSNTGTLSYDADGNGTKQAVQIAFIGQGLLLTEADFIIA